jgi:DNA-binding FrmR family transcriptional regulator
MEKHITTIEGLAEMLQRTMASKEDIKAVTTRLDGIDGRLDRIEHLLLAKQKREIEDLKTRMKRLEDALAV